MNKRNYDIDKEKLLKEQLKDANDFRCYWYNSMKYWIASTDAKRVKRAVKLFEFWSRQYEQTKAQLEQLQRTK